MSKDEIKHPLATLMKQKYGVTKQSSLRLKSDDSLFVVFRKIANYIYKMENGMIKIMQMLLNPTWKILTEVILTKEKLQA